MARKLAFVMQRCAFPFSQEVPNDPDGYRYVWHSNHRGRILLERVRLPEGQDAWLFSRGTPAQPRRAGRGLPRQAARPAVRAARRRDRRGRAGRRPAGAGAAARRASRPGSARPGRPCARSSSRWTSWSSTASGPRTSWPASTSSELSPEDRAGVGLRLAAKLEAILHRLRVDLMTVPDTWEADPLVLGRDTEWQVTLARGTDGAWRFDRETVARVPDLFERLTPEEKTARERRSNFHSAQQAMRTLLHAADAGDLDLAARCLDLDGIPPGARDELGPILAYKLKFVLDRIGRVARGGDPRRGRRPPLLLPPRPAGAHRPGAARRGAPPRRLAVLARDRRADRGDVPRRGRPPGRPGPGPGRGPSAGPVAAADPLAVAPLPAARLAAEPRAGARPLPVDRPGRRPGGRRGGLVAGAAGRRAAGVPPAAAGPDRGRSGPRRLQAAAAGVPARPVVPVPPAPAARPAGRRRRRRRSRRSRSPGSA